MQGDTSVATSLFLFVLFAVHGHVFSSILHTFYFATVAFLRRDLRLFYIT